MENCRGWPNNLASFLAQGYILCVSFQVCEEAKCPNISECWGGGEHETATATIMVCTGEKKKQQMSLGEYVKYTVL